MEQENLLSSVRKELNIVQCNLVRVRRQIDLIREYRTRLIADVVTGKIDVRDIPVEAVPEDEAFEEFTETEVSDEHAEPNVQEIL